MKKLVLVLFVALVAMSVSAQTIQLGNFPVGQWLDHNYNAIWEFSSNNIKILGTNGAVLHDFSNYTIQNFRVFMEGTQPGRSYRFIKPLSNSDLTMEIEREGQPSYSVTQRQWTGQLPTPPAQPAAVGSGGIPDGIYVGEWGYGERWDGHYRRVRVFSGNTFREGTSNTDKPVLQLSDIELGEDVINYTVRNGMFATITMFEGEEYVEERPYTLVGKTLTHYGETFTRQ